MKCSMYFILALFPFNSRNLHWKMCAGYILLHKILSQIVFLLGDCWLKNIKYNKKPQILIFRIFATLKYSCLIQDGTTLWIMCAMCLHIRIQNDISSFINSFIHALWKYHAPLAHAEAANGHVKILLLRTVATLITGFTYA